MMNSSSNYKCNKCLKSVPESNKFLHNAQCKPKNYSIKCSKCKANINSNEIDDHMLCHEFENENVVENENAESLRDREHNRLDMMIRNILINPQRERSRVRIINNEIIPNNFNNQEVQINSNRTRHIYDFSQIINQLLKDQSNPVDENLINMLPETKIKNVDKLPQDKRNCVICMEDFKENELIITIPCYHIFHKNCIGEWFKKDNTCPICKFVLNQENFNKI